MYVEYGEVKSMKKIQNILKKRLILYKYYVS